MIGTVTILTEISADLLLFSDEELRTVTSYGDINLLLHVSAFVERYCQTV
jgi:hypothetical protein